MNWKRSTSPSVTLARDYFDVMDLAGGRTLFAIADVSGKGMSAALLAANIQALVRSIAATTADPLEFARRINEHLIHYTPSDRFATAVFAVLDRGSGQLTYVNAGHNAPVLANGSSASLLRATGVPLGLMAEVEYESGTIKIAPGGMLLLYTDGLTDSIRGGDPEVRLREALASSPTEAIQNLKSMIDPKSNEDDVTILLVRRAADPAETNLHALR
jgi:phosphoserine phosphatase RsbU/P